MKEATSRKYCYYKYEDKDKILNKLEYNKSQN